MKGFLTGIVAGAVVSGVGFVAGERYLPRVDLQLPAPEAGDVAVPAGSEFNTERPDAPPILPSAESPPESGAAPVVAAPGAETGALPDTTPLDAPEAAPMAETGLTPPAAAPTPVIVSGSTAEPVPQPGVSQPDAPQVHTAATPAEAIEAPGGPAPAEALETPDLSEAPPQAPATDLEPTVPAVADAPEAPAVETAMATPESAQTPDAPAPDTEMAAPESEGAPEVAVTGTPPAAPASEAVPVAPEQSVASIDAPPVAVPDAPPLALPDAPEGLRLPTTPQIEDMAPGVTTDRLPRIGAETAEPVDSKEPALTRNAVPFERPEGSPLVALVLVDVGDVRPEASVLAEFPLPLSVAIDPTAPDAPALMLAYRQAGLEVAILTPLSEGASPADVEVAFQSYFTTVPEAVAVMDLPEALLQESRPRAAQVVGILAESGHGLVTYEKGLNTVMQIADQSEVPAATVFRDIDPGTHDVAAMKRFLDQAAFRAGLDGRIILKAESRDETLQALAEWSMSSRAASVTFVPISAVLKP